MRSVAWIALVAEWSIAADSLDRQKLLLKSSAPENRTS